MKIKELTGLIIRYPTKIIKWIKDGRFHNATILIFIITICYLLGKISFEPKIVSIVFLIIGLAIIIWQMIGDSKRFSEQSPNTFKFWIKKFPSIKPEGRIINESSGVIVTTGFKPHVSVSIAENASLDEKVNFLMKQKDEMETAINNVDNKLDTKVTELNKKIKGIENKVEETKKIINSTISDITVGNYDLRLLSIVLMICGTFIQMLV